MGNIKPSNIPNRLRNVSAEHPYVAGAVDIYDDILGKPQSQVNQERIQEENTLDGKIATEKQRAEGIESGLEGRLETVEGLAEISVGGGDIQIATGADFDSPDATKRAKAVTVGAMLDGMINSPVFDLSAYTGDSYANLDAALTVMDAAGFPSQLKKGGMTLKFVQSSDNNYKQYRLMWKDWTDNVKFWQGCDVEPKPNSRNIVESGGVFKYIGLPFLENDGNIDIAINVPSSTFVQIPIKTFGGKEYGATISNINAIITSNVNASTIPVQDRIVSLTSLSDGSYTFTPSATGKYLYIYSSSGGSVTITLSTDNVDSRINSLVTEKNRLAELINAEKNKQIYIKSFATSMELAGITSNGEIYFNVSTNKLIRVDNISANPIVYTEIPLYENGIYIYNGYIYRYNGTTLVNTGVCNIDFLGKSISEAGVNAGNSYFYNTSNKKLFLVNGSNGSFTYTQIPLKRNVIYNHNTSLYLYDGTELVLKLEVVYIKSFAPSMAAANITSNGDVMFNTSSNKLLRFDDVSTTPFTYTEITPTSTKPNVIYIYDGNIVTWNGTTFVFALHNGKILTYSEEGESQTPVSVENGYMSSSDESEPLVILNNFKTAKFSVANIGSISLTGRCYCVYEYDSNGTLIQSIATGSAVNYNGKLVELSGHGYIKVSYDADKSFSVKNVSVDNKDDSTRRIDIDKLNKRTANSIPSGINFCGHTNIPNIINYDICHFIEYGQSLSCGTQSAHAITTSPVSRNYMLGFSVWDTISDFFTPLKATIHPDRRAEDSIVTAINSLSTLYHKYVNPEQRFLASSVGVGGYTTAQLSKNGRFENIKYQETPDGYYVAHPYETNFLSVLNNAKAAADASKLSIGCAAILYMQGEADWAHESYDEHGLSTHSAGSKDAYKQYVLQLKNDMQNDIQSIYGQSQKPLFFIYQTGGKYIYDKTMFIPQAQLELAMENDDIILMNPTYFTPDFSHGHLSTNGYRWYGEKIAESLWFTLVNKTKRYPVMPTQFIKSQNDVTIYFRCNKLPLVIDRLTLEPMKNDGFMIYKNDAEVTIQSVEVINNSVVLHTNEDLSNGTIAVSYAGLLNPNEPSLERGQGNLRDSSDDFKSMYTYWNDSNEKGTYPDTVTHSDDVTYKPTQLYGKKYPMWDWCCEFYQILT